MEPILEFFKSKKLIAWVAINTVLPVFLIGFIRQIDVATSLTLPILGKQILAIFSIAIILIANIYCAKRWRGTPAFKYFVGIIPLNIASIFFTSNISFITSLVVWSMYIEGIAFYYNMLIGVQ